jgi:hypothetical protein
VFRTVRRLADDLRAAGNDIEFHHYSGSGYLDLPDQSLADTLRFVNTLLPAGPVNLT